MSLATTKAKLEYFKTHGSKLPMVDGVPLLADIVVNAGQKNFVKLIVKNPLVDKIQLFGPFTEDKRVKIISFPEILLSDEEGLIEMSIDVSDSDVNPPTAGFGFEQILIG